MIAFHVTVRQAGSVLRLGMIARSAADVVCHCLGTFDDNVPFSIFVKAARP